jgi:hypothetical protein
MGNKNQFIGGFVPSLTHMWIIGNYCGENLLQLKQIFNISFWDRKW